MITKPCFKSRSMFKAVLSSWQNQLVITQLVRIRSIQLPLLLKHVFNLIELYKLEECITNLGFLGSMLKSPRIIWLS